MKKIILIAFLIVFSLNAFAVNPDSNPKSENPGVPDKKENKMSDEELKSLTKPVDEIRDTENEKQTIVVEKRRSGRNHGLNRENRRNGGVVFIGGGTLLLIILLVILLV